uniref:Rho-GAP domain-containing protein n=1 Tax=Macrostomum lignano TaxID=282301 RepID=A0A1I8IRA8_9PLAT
RHPSRQSVQGSWASSGHGTLPRPSGPAGSPAHSQQQQHQQQQSETSTDSGFDAANGASGGWFAVSDEASLSGRVLLPTSSRFSSLQQQQQQQQAAAVPRTNPSAGVYGRTSASLFDSSSRSLSVASVASEGASSAYQLPSGSSLSPWSHQFAPSYPLPPGWSLTLFRREHNPAKLLCWTRRDLSRPLLAATEKSLKRESSDNFKIIQRYMGDRRMKKLSQPVLAWQMVQLGLQSPGLRDEQFMQLCRQLTNNPNGESLQLGWELLAICLAFFPPSGGFAPYLEGFLLRHCQRLEPTCPFRAQQQYAGVCYQRLRRILRMGARKGSQAPSVDEVSIAKKTVVTPGVFGCTLEDLMLQQRQRGFPELEQPWILTVLTEDTIRLGGQLTEGIFRNPGDFDALNVARTQLEQWDLTACRRLSDPRVTASLLVTWLRELAEPLIPTRLYQRALDCHDRPDEALALVARQLSPLNQRVLRHVIRFLRLFAEPNVASVTGIDAGGLALLMAPCLLRSPESSSTVFRDFAMDNARQEAAFVRLLLLHLPESAAAMGGGSGGGGGLLGLSSLSVIRDDLPEIDEEPAINHQHPQQQQQQQSIASSSSLLLNFNANATATSATVTTAADDDDENEDAADDINEEADFVNEADNKADWKQKAKNAQSLDSLPPPLLKMSNAELQAMLAEKAKELFDVCDIEQKGFITKRDMQRLSGIEDVFDRLDDDGNGYLTLEEFTGGFGSFMGLASGSGDGATGGGGGGEADGEYIEEGRR